MKRDPIHQQITNLEDLLDCARRSMTFNFDFRTAELHQEFLKVEENNVRVCKEALQYARQLADDESQELQALVDR